MQQKEHFEAPGSVREAHRLQRELAGRLSLVANLPEPGTIGALDGAYGKDGRTLYVGVAILSFPELNLIEQTRAQGDAERTFGPDLAYFSESRIIRQALHQLQTDPDILIVHGHGTMHPRGCGKASHIGLEFDIPTIGCSRRQLVGSHKPVGSEKGSMQPVFVGGKTAGIAYRTRDGVKPLYISPGHRCDLTFARETVIRCLRGFRMPEPLRLAHLYANKYKRRRD